jgi:hypothetical protein
MRRILTAALIFCLSGLPVLGQEIQTDVTSKPGPITTALRVEMARLASAQAAQPAQNDAYRPGGMSPAYFWTAIGLMGVGGANLLGGLVLANDDDICDDAEDILDTDLDCGGIGTTATIIGASMVGAGAVVYMLGKKKAASASPSVVFGPGKVAVRSRVSF